jgi:hypothetical protein
VPGAATLGALGAAEFTSDALPSPPAPRKATVCVGLAPAGSATVATCVARRVSMSGVTPTLLIG